MSIPEMPGARLITEEEQEQRLRQAQREAHAADALPSPAKSVEQAMMLLGVDGPATAEDILVAFRHAAKARRLADPDHGDIADLQQARDVLMDEFVNRREPEIESFTCKICGGSGKVSTGFGARDCPGCNGSGSQR